ncbi:MAG: hypothetical protein IIA61_00015 [Candidatus Marinimicrobia bacterium]|nr:hypothetical protein [Candidatus Neomarinimicrobiota bacterium]
MIRTAGSWKIRILHCSSSVNTWGEEVYFPVSIDANLELDSQQVVPPGTVCFWVEGSSLNPNKTFD